MKVISEKVISEKAYMKACKAMKIATHDATEIEKHRGVILRDEDKRYRVMKNQRVLEIRGSKVMPQSKLKKKSIRKIARIGE